MKNNVLKIRSLLLLSLLLLLASCGKEPAGQNHSIAIYPNPVTTFLYLDGDYMQHYTLFDGIGRIVGDGDINGNLYMIDVSYLSEGNYLLRIVFPDEVVNKPVSILGFDPFENPVH